ncbi:MAG: translocation/assembly module TamB domain-containing protein [Gammaproteobacteria bacterium]
MKRIIRNALLLAAIGLIAAIAFVLTSEAGLRMVWRQVEPLLPAELEIDLVSGRLLGPVQVRNLVFRNASVRLELEEAQIEWSPLALASGSLSLERVEAQGLSYTALASETSGNKSDFVLPARLELGWDLVVRQLTIRNIAIQLQEGIEPLRIETLESQARFVDGRLDLKHLAIDAQRFEVSGSGGISARDKYPVDGNWHWRVLIPGYPALVGDTRLGGSLETLSVYQRLAAPYSLEAEVDLSGLFDQLRFDGRFLIRELAVQAVKPDAPDLLITTDLSANGTLDQISFSADTEVVSVEVGPLLSRIEGRYQPGVLAVDSLLATIPGQPGELQANGRIELSEQALVDVQTQWTELRWPLQGTADLNSSSGRMHLTGLIDAYELSGEGQIDAPAYTDATVSFEGRGDRLGLTLARLDLETLDGNIGGSAEIGWDTRIEVTAELQGQDLNPGVLLPQWPGRLNLAISAEAGLANGQISADVHKLDADGVLRGYPMQLRSAGQYADGNMDLDSFVLESGQSELEARGRIGRSLDMSWSLQSTDLSSLSPAAAGQVSAGGSATGRPDKPRITAVIDGKMLTYQTYSINTLALDADVDLEGKTPSRFELQLTSGKLAGVQVNSLSIDGSGQPLDHNIRVEADTELGSADVSLSGVLADAGWSWRATAATVAYPDLDPWILQEPARGRVDRTQFVLENSCWTSQGAILCAAMSASAGSISTSFTLEHLRAQYFASLLPSGVIIDGELGGQGRLERSADGFLTTNLSLDTTRGSLATQADGDTIVQLLEFEPGHVGLDMNPEGLRFDASFPLAGQGLIALEASVGAGQDPLMERPLRGRLVTEVRDVRFVSELVAELTRIEGRLEGKAQLAGTLGRPTINGRIALEDATATLDRPGLTLEDLRLELVGQDSGMVALKAQARSGSGTLNVEGTADLAAAADAETVRADFRIFGSQFKVLDTPETELWATPDLQLALKGKRVDITGEIHLPRGSIQPKQLPKSAVTVSPDQVIIDQVTPSASSGRYAVNTRIRLTLGDRVEFSGFGLKGRFAGNLVLTDKPEKPTTATGELRILDGSYKAYGQNLNIRTGRLLFAGGPVTEPGLDVEAARQAAADVLVGIRVRGSLKEPEFSLFSDPAMSQSEQLSYLVLGRPLDRGATTDEQNSMNQAAMGLGLASGALLGDDFGERLGLDEFGLESGPGTTSDQASLLVGKYLSPSLYVSYGLGLFEPISTYRVRYILSSKWSVVGETSANQSGADVFYVIEAGK